MEKNYGDLEIDENRLKAADPVGLYLFMLKDYPYTFYLSPFYQHGTLLLLTEEPESC